MRETDPISPTSDPTPTRVLVAEDNDKARISLVGLLERHGFEVTAVNDGRAALNLLSAPNPPPIALIDWEMPRLNGLEVCSALRKITGKRYKYIIMLTARDEPSDVLAGFAAGVDDFLTKPVDTQELLARMRCGERVLALEARGVERIVALEKALDEVRQLKRLLPICMYCKKVRDDSDYWHEIDAYIHKQTGTDFSHGICPGCMETVVAQECSPEAKAQRARQNM